MTFNAKLIHVIANAHCRSLRQSLLSSVFLLLGGLLLGSFLLSHAAAQAVTVQGISITEEGKALPGYDPLPHLVTLNLESFQSYPLDLDVAVSGDRVGSVGVRIKDAGLLDAQQEPRPLVNRNGKAFENQAPYSFTWIPSRNPEDFVLLPQRLIVSVYARPNGEGEVLASYETELRVFPSSDALRNDIFGPIDAPPLPPDYITLQPGDDLQAEIDRHPNGTAFVLEQGVYYAQSLRLKRGVKLIGEGAGVVLDGRLGPEVEANDLEQRRNWAIKGAPNTEVRNLEIRYYGTHSLGRPAVDTYQADGMTVAFNYIHHNYSSNVNIAKGENITLRKNKLTHGGRYGVSGSQSVGGVVENNEIAFSNVLGLDPGDNAAGTKFVAARELSLRNNYVHDNAGTGLWIDIFGNHVDIIGNLSIRNQSPPEFASQPANGIFFEISDNGAIVANTVKSNAGYGILISESGSGNPPTAPPFASGVVVEKNFMHNNLTGIFVKSQCRDTPQYSENVRVADNTIINASTNPKNTPARKVISVSVRNRGCDNWPDGVNAATIRETITFENNLYAKARENELAPIETAHLYQYSPASP